MLLGMLLGKLKYGIILKNCFLSSWSDASGNEVQEPISGVTRGPRADFDQDHEDFEIFTSLFL